MAIRALFLNGIITRRLFAIFLLFALAPVCLLSYLAVVRISAATEQQVQQMLQGEASNISNLVLVRLNFIHHQLMLFNSAGVYEHNSSEESIPGGYVRPVSYSADDIYWNPEFSALTSTLLGQGDAAIVAGVRGKNDASIMMVRRIEPNSVDSRLRAIPITAQQLLGSEDRRNLHYDYCVLDLTGTMLFETQPELCGQFSRAVGSGSAHKGHLKLGVNGEHVSSYRTLFLEESYASPDWLVVAVAPTDELFSASYLFKSNFLTIAIAVILALALFSIYFIRTRMAPLAVIMAGIERVSAKQYDDPVEVTSGDEFEELANAFNTMSGQVSRQLNVMASMADLDRLILSHPSKEAVIRVVLASAGTLLKCESVGLVLLESEAQASTGEDTASSLYTEPPDADTPLEKRGMSLPSDWWQALEERPVWLQRSPIDGDAAVSNYFSSKVSSFYALPLQKEGKLAGAIVLGYCEQPQNDTDAEAVASNFADRISIALTNSEWETRLYQQAHFDSLTGLPNRLSMQDRIDLSVRQCARSGDSFAVSFIDLDDFKLVNDALGHMSGDKLIQTVAQRVASCVRGNDMISRMGGDEFVFVSAPFPTNEDAAMATSRIAEKILKAISEPVDIAGREIRASASLGIAIFPRDGTDAVTMLRNADAAMYAAKKQGAGSYHFFSEKLNAESLSLMALTSDMKRALEQHEFELHYQPKFDAHNNSLVGAEALIRWQHPTRGMIPPGVFIEVAERMGLIGDIGYWTLNEACRQINLWKNQGQKPPRIAVNMSAIQIQQEDIPAIVLSLLHEHDIEAKYLELEIAESVLVEDIEEATRKFFSLREMGVHISVDDYGTGFSSLSYIKHFPVNTLKIDRCFITDICTDSSDEAIVLSTIILAHKMGLNVIAEGVETAEQLAKLKELGCDQIQGYYFSKPVPATDFSGFLSGGKSLPEL